jgi:Family of unknown function (DUF6074)
MSDDDIDDFVIVWSAVRETIRQPRASNDRAASLDAGVVAGKPTSPGPQPAAKTAKLIPFPAARRHKLVVNLAAQMMTRAPEAAAAHLRLQLQVQFEVLCRKGIAEHVAREEMRNLELAARIELCRLVLLTPRAPDTRA